LVVGSALWFLGGQMFITGMLATAIAWNRRMMEDLTYRMKLDRADEMDQRAPRRPVFQFVSPSGPDEGTHTRREQHVA
jgi:hypothetical protein